MKIWDLNLRHLEAVAKIADCGTMSAAAAAVNLTQPAITQGLSRTERLLGVPLFERRADGMTPTAEADLLAPRIRAALDLIASPQVTMARLRAIIALADTGSYTAASLQTGLSLPSLHRAVNDLSLSLRRPLVERRGKAVSLTDAGRTFARRFRLARVELEAGLAELEALRGNETRRIAIGAMPLSRARVLPAAVTRFQQRHPEVRISIIEGSHAELVEPLRNGAIDFMVGALREPLIDPDLVQQPLFSDSPVIVGRYGHPLAETAPGFEALAAYPWVVPAPGAPLRASWERMFTGEGVTPPAVPVECGSVMAIRQMLIDSDLLTLLSVDQIAVELEARWLRVIGEVPPAHARTIGITTRASWMPTSVQAQFVEMLQAVSAPISSGNKD